MSIAMGPVPSSAVATDTWHVVGLHGGEQEACPLAGSRCGLGESSSSVTAWGGQEHTLAQRSLLDFGKWHYMRGKGREKKGGRRAGVRREEDVKVEEEEERV